MVIMPTRKEALQSHEKVSVVLIYPPVVKPGEPPAGIARLAGALRSNAVSCAVIDANVEGMYALLEKCEPPGDTWSRRAYRHCEDHLQALRTPFTYTQPERYQRAVADIGRLLTLSGRADQIRVGLGDYGDLQWTPVRSTDLRQAARQPERNPFFNYYQERLLPRIGALQPSVVGLSINYLSQALCAFALIGLLKKAYPGLKIMAGGGLITSWLRRPGRCAGFGDLIDHMVAGPGEAALLAAVGAAASDSFCCPDYSDVRNVAYLSPGFVLPFSASDGCWWRRCAFCPERAERRPFHPLPHHTATGHLRHLVAQTQPVLVHLLDNALSPALLKALAVEPPGAAWYGFVRIGKPLDDLDFCRRLAAAGCVMLKVGLESGSQSVLDALEKGLRLDMAEKVLDNLRMAGIASYVYLLFGTPAEDAAAAHKTLDFVVAHQELIGFLNMAVFNLPLDSPDAAELQSRDFYQGDLALYRDFEHPAGWGRIQVRRYLDRTFKRHPAIQRIVRRDPPVFTSNHAPFFTPAVLK